MPHTKGDHCPPQWAAIAGSWWGETCFCDRVEPLVQNFSFVQENITSQQPSGNMSITVTSSGNQWIYPYVPAPIVFPQPQPYTVVIGHVCNHECDSKVLNELIKVLVDRITELSSKIGTLEKRPVNETRGIKK